MERLQSFKRRSKDSSGKRGDTPLHLAARAGNVTLVKDILSGCDGGRLKDLLSRQNQDEETALYVAAENGHAAVVHELVMLSDMQSAALKAKNSFDAFHIAAKQGHVEVLKELLQAFPSLSMTTNSTNSTALDTAASLGHIDVVNLLLESDASLAKIARSNGKTALHAAARMGYVEVARSLLDKDPSIGFRPDRKGQTAFHMAVKGQNVAMVQELLKPDLSIINSEDNKGNTALHIAARKGRTPILQTLLAVEGINVNAINKAKETALDIAEKSGNDEMAAILRVAGASTAKELEKPASPAKQLKQTVSDIKHDVQSQIQQTRQTGVRVHKIKRRLKKLHMSGLNNAINYATVVAVLIATVAFAAIFTVPGQYVDSPKPGLTLGQAYMATNASFILFFVFDSLALFISLAVVVVQTSIVVIEQKAKKQLVFVINKLMWLACLFISASFISLTFVVVGGKSKWLAYSTTAIGVSIMFVTLGSMMYCIVAHRREESNMRNIRKASVSRSHSWSVSMASDSELLNSEYKRIYAL
ncbi:Ankyrin repeat-containing protein [Acorus gramineus]|uniref:Ankyrin repeat-containing protein n=1 Tax=Acorus gramineus TaxID=55184 RepID=A0AAV9B4B0_ACOGR|nr:Ankyrin repeat-containing protein [Acorus gramineus]